MGNGRTTHPALQIACGIVGGDVVAAPAAAFGDRLAPTPDERVLDVECGTGNLALRAARRHAVLGLPVAPAAAVEHFATWYGPTGRAVAALDAAGRTSLRRTLVELWTAHDRAADGATRVDAAYLEVLASR